MSNGWIPAHRRIYEPGHWLAPSQRDPSCRRDAWLDLCQMATHQPRETPKSGVLDPGELVASLRTLGKRWMWSKDRVKRFVSELEVRTAIETLRETPDGTVYRVVNYETYAISRYTDRDNERDTKRDRSETEARQEQQLNQETPPIGPPLGKRKTRLPDGWRPTAQHRERAQIEGVDCDREAEKFRAHHGAKGSRFVSWNRAFTTWLLKAGEWAGSTNGRRSSSRTLEDAIMSRAAVDRFEAIQDDA